MSTTVQVPINTMLADLDESLKTLLKRDLDRHGFDGVEIVFDAPDKEWAASLSSPAVNLFLYDIREAKELRPIDWEERVRDGHTFDLRPPLRIDASYAVTAWTRDVQDEHRLLSQTMAILYAFPTLPVDVLSASLANGSQRYPLKTTHGPGPPRGRLGLLERGRGTVQGVVQLRGHALVRGGRLARARPEVRTATTRLFDRDSRAATMHELHRSGGTVVDADGAGVRNVWVHLRETGQLAVSDDEGRFRFDRLRPGSYTVTARGPDGKEVKGKLEIPGQGVELTLPLGDSHQT